MAKAASKREANGKIAKQKNIAEKAANRKARRALRRTNRIAKKVQEEEETLGLGAAMRGLRVDSLSNSERRKQWKQERKEKILAKRAAERAKKAANRAKRVGGGSTYRPQEPREAEGGAGNEVGDNKVDVDMSDAAD